MPIDACMSPPNSLLGALEDRVSLAACPSSAGHPAWPSEQKHRAKPRSGSLILLVDDDTFIRETVGSMILQLGFVPVLAPTGEEALAELEGGLEPSLVILDMDMPGLGGAGTLPLIRMQKPDLPVVISTGRVNAKVDQLLRDYSHVALLPKPFRFQELKDRLS
jgi:CheY-like chemotaxis protein